MALDPSILFSIYSESKDEIFANTIWNNQCLFFPEDTVKDMFHSGNTENRGDFKIYSLTKLFELQEKGKNSKTIQEVMDAFAIAQK
jgi:hypothetical protein